MGTEAGTCGAEQQSVQLGFNGTLGTPETTSYSYDSRERVHGIFTGELADPGESQNFTLTYDDAGNVRTAVDGWASETATYGYDELNRLKTMTLDENGTTEPGASYTYDTIGNLLTKQEGAASSTLYYQWGGSYLYGPHIAWGLADNSTGATQLFAYDRNGNICGSGNWLSCPSIDGYHVNETLFQYDAGNRLTKTPGATAGTDTFDSFTYDASGTEVMRTMADGTSTVYVGGVYEEQRDAGGAVTGVTKYYQGFGRMVAMRDASGAVCGEAPRHGDGAPRLCCAA